MAKQRGFSTVEIAIGLVVLALLAAASWYVLSKKDAVPAPAAPAKTATTDEPETEAKLVQKQIESIRLRFSYPSTWQLVSDDEEGYTALSAPDGWSLGIAVTTEPLIPKPDNTNTVAKVLATTPLGSIVVPVDEGDPKPYYTIALREPGLQLGHQSSLSHTLTNPAAPGLYVFIGAGAPAPSDNLDAFINQPSALAALAILQTVEFY